MTPERFRSPRAVAIPAGDRERLEHLCRYVEIVIVFVGVLVYDAHSHEEARRLRMPTTSVEDLEVFKLAHALVLKVYEVTRTFPREETFGLVRQLRRAAASVVANLAEGAGRLNRAEYRQFAGIARGSAAEASYHLLLAPDLGYVAHYDSLKLREDYSRVGQMLTRLTQALQ